MRKSIATVSVSGVLTEKLDAVAAAGFDGVEVFDNDLVSSPLLAARGRGRAAPTSACGSSCSSRCATSRAWLPSGSTRSCTGCAPSSA